MTTPAQAEFRLYSHEQTVGGIVLYVNANFIHFKQEGIISPLSGKPIQLVNQFLYLDSNILSTESDVNICIA